MGVYVIIGLQMYFLRSINLIKNHYAFCIAALKFDFLFTYRYSLCANTTCALRYIARQYVSKPFLGRIRLRRMPRKGTLRNDELLTKLRNTFVKSSNLERKRCLLLYISQLDMSRWTAVKNLYVINV